MRRLLLLNILVISLVASCKQDTMYSPDKEAYQKIYGRDNGKALKRYPIYRAKVPLHWLRFDPPETASIFDSRQPLVTFIIKDTIKVTVHNFPVQDLSDRIPPQAQLMRWKRQFQTIDFLSERIESQAFGGFQGLLWQATDNHTHQKQTVIALAMQMGDIPLRFLREQSDDSYFQQASADYTIKALGPREEIEKEQSNILNFMRSFELIESINASF